MIRYSFTLFFVLIVNSSLAQRLHPGYVVTNSGIDTVYGEFKRPSSEVAIPPSFDQLFLAGQKFEYVQVENSWQLLQRLSGEKLRLYRNLDLGNPTYYIKNGERFSKLTEERINLEFGKHFSPCSALSNAMAYTKVKYKTNSLVELVDQYADCIDVPNPGWTRSDSLEFNLSFAVFSGASKVQDQPFKDHSGDFNSIHFQGWGLTVTAFSDRKIRLTTGIKAYDMSTINPRANVSPFNDPTFNSAVEYRWSSYEVPLAVAYSFQFSSWRAYAGLGGSIIITDNLTVGELFSAPFLTAPEEVRAQLTVNDHFGFGGMVGIERKLGQRWMVGIQYELQRSQMDFNLVRVDRNLEQEPPIIATYRISTLELFASATDLTKLRFTTSRLSISLKFRAFRNYKTFN